MLNVCSQLDYSLFFFCFKQLILSLLDFVFIAVVSLVLQLLCLSCV